MERLASGKRVNSARDGGAELAISNGLESQKRGLLQAFRNINDAQATTQIADGSLSEQINIIHRMKELSLQAANGALSDQNREFLDIEIQQLLSEFDRISSEANFRGVNLLDGSFGTKNIQVGANKNHTIELSLESSKADYIFVKTVGTGTFQNPTNVTAGTGAHVFDTADLNGDGLLDLLTSNYPVNNMSVVLQADNGTFFGPTVMATDLSPFESVIDDFNNDGNLDTAINNSTSSTISIYIGNGNGTFQNQVTISTSNTPIGLVSGDINNDGNVDLFSAGSGDSTISVFLGRGDGTFATRTTIQSGSSPHGVALGDVNRDGRLDLINSDYLSNTVSILLGNGDGTFATRTTLATGTFPINAQLEDIDSNGTLDIFVNNSTANTISIYLGNGDGTFQNQTTVATGSGTRYIDFGDLNGDGNLDMVDGDNNTTTLLIYFGNGDGTFQPSKSLTQTTNNRGIVLSDMDGNGALDIISGNATPTSVYIFYGDSKQVSAKDDVTISTQQSAEDLLDILDNALTLLSEKRSTLGALQNRLEFAKNNIQTMTENLSSSLSQIIDTDFAIETAELARLQILQSMGMSVFSQINLHQRLTLKLFETIG